MTMFPFPALFSGFCSDYYLHFKQEMLNEGFLDKYKKRDVFYII